MYGKFRTRVGEIIRKLCRKRRVELLEGHLMMDHIHMCLKVPPKFSIAFVIGFIKGKSAVLIHRTVLKEKKVTGLHFWARSYSVGTVDLDEQTIRKYIREQEHYEKQQLEFDFDKPKAPAVLYLRFSPLWGLPEATRYAGGGSLSLAVAESLRMMLSFMAFFDNLDLKGE